MADGVAQRPERSVEIELDGRAWKGDAREKLGAGGVEVASINENGGAHDALLDLVVVRGPLSGPSI